MDTLTTGRAAADWDDLLCGERGLWFKGIEIGTGVVWWHMVAPCGHHGILEHDVTEHEDRSITVSPSIKCSECAWHGWLERGVWRQV